MRKPIIVFLLVGVLACNKDEPAKHTSVAGDWVVRTPDQATSVGFRVERDQDNVFQITRVHVNHSGTDYNSKPVDAAINVTTETEIESIIFVNNSTEIPFFVIRFQQISVDGNFSEMTISNSIFNIDGAFREFPMIKATR